MIDTIPLEQLNTYESCCDYARAQGEELDARRWIIGDVANTVMERWQERTVSDFARDIGQRKSTVYQWAKVSLFYENSLRCRLLDNYSNLTYSHLRDALRLNDVDAAVAWLEEVSDNGWTVDEASYHLTDKLGRKIIEGEVVRKYMQDDGLYLVVRVTDDSAGFELGRAIVMKGR